MDLTDIRNAVAKFSEDAPKPVSEKQRVLEQLKGQISKKDLAALTLHQALEVLTLIVEIPEVEALHRSGDTITIGEITRKERGPRAPKVMDDAESEDVDDAEEDAA